MEACNCHEHRGLLAAVRLRDAAAAQALMLQHLDALEATLCFNLPEPRPGLVALLAGGTGPRGRHQAGNQAGKQAGNKTGNPPGTQPGNPAGSPPGQRSGA